MLEGLQSNDSAVRSLTQSWVRAAVSCSSSEGTHRLLQPLVRILLDSNSKRKLKASNLLAKKITLSRKDAEKDMKYANYYFQSRGMENPYLPSSKDQYVEIVQHYTQTFDTSQILYVLSLLQLVVEADATGFIRTVGNTVIDVTMYATCSAHATNMYPSTPGRAEAESPEPSTATSLSLASQKSLLEVVLSVCVDLLCSEYQPSLKAPPDEQLDNLRVKISCASLLSTLLSNMLDILSAVGPAAGEDSVFTEFKVCSPNFVSALLTLCDIQKVVLLLMGKAVEWWYEISDDASSSRASAKNGVWFQTARRLRSEGGGDPGVMLKSFFTHLLRVVQCLIVLDTQFSQSLPIKSTGSHSSPTSDLVTFVSGVQISAPLSAVVPGCATASQRFFGEFLLQVLSEVTLAQFHNDLLHMFTSTVSNLLSQQLADLVPKVVKQLCGNMEEAARSSAGKSKRIENDSGGSGDVHHCVTYFNCVLIVTSWCLFGETRLHPSKDEIVPSSSSSSVIARSRSHSHLLYHTSPNPFFNVARVKQAEGARDILSPTNKQTSTMDWLLGVFTGQTKASSVGEADGLAGEAGGLCSRVGVGSQAGQQVVMLLPAVYNSMTDVWLELCGQHAVEYQAGRDGGGGSWGFSGGAESMEKWKQSMLFEVSGL